MKPVILFWVALIGLTNFYHAQSQALSQPNIFFGADINGTRTTEEWISTEIKGSPFLIKVWATARITLKDNRSFQNIPVRLNCVNNNLHYLNEKKEELVAPAGVIKEVVLVDSSGIGVKEHTLVSGFPAIDKHDANTFYEQLVNGKVQLLAYTKKRMQETRTMGSAGPEREYITSEDLFVHKAGVIQEWKKGKDFLLELLSDKREAVAEYIKSQNLKCRSVDDAKMVISFYNKQS